MAISDLFDENGNFIWQGGLNLANKPTPQAPVANNYANLGNYGVNKSLDMNVTPGKKGFGLSYDNIPGTGGVTPEKTGFWGDMSPFQKGLAGVSAVGTIGNLFLGLKGLKLSKKQFQFSKDTFNKNLENQAKLTNQQLQKQEFADLAQTGQYANTTIADRTALQAKADANLRKRDTLVSGAAI